MTFVVTPASQELIISDLQQRVASLERLLQFYMNTTYVLTGAGSASLGTNCPAVDPTAPHTWIQTVESIDGDIVYVPVWR